MQHIESGRGGTRRERRWLQAAAAVVVVAGVGCATYWPTVSGRSPRSSGDAYQCVMDQLKELGYAPRTFNADNGSIDAQRINRDMSSALPQEQQEVDKLLIQTKRESDNATMLHVRAETVIRRFTRVGWVEDGVKASPAVKQSAHALIDRCSGAS